MSTAMASKQKLQGETNNSQSNQEKATTLHTESQKITSYTAKRENINDKNKEKQDIKQEPYIPINLPNKAVDKKLIKGNNNKHKYILVLKIILKNITRLAIKYNYKTEIIFFEKFSLK